MIEDRKKFIGMSFQSKSGNMGKIVDIDGGKFVTTYTQEPSPEDVTEMVAWVAKMTGTDMVGSTAVLMPPDTEEGLKKNANKLTAMLLDSMMIRIMRGIIESMDQPFKARSGNTCLIQVAEDNKGLDSFWVTEPTEADSHDCQYYIYDLYSKWQAERQVQLKRARAYGSN